MILNEYFRHLELAIVSDEDISRDTVMHNIAGCLEKMVHSALLSKDG